LDDDDELYFTITATTEPLDDSDKSDKSLDNFSEPLDNFSKFLGDAAKPLDDFSKPLDDDSSKNMCEILRKDESAEEARARFLKR